MEDRLKALEDQIRGILQILQRLSNENLSNRILNLDKKVDETTKAIRKSFIERDKRMVLQKDMNKKELSEQHTHVTNLTESVTKFYDEMESFKSQIQKLEKEIDEDIEVKVYNECIAIEKNLEKKIDDIQEKIQSMNGYPTDVQSDEEDERGPPDNNMVVEKLQQRVDDILKF